MTANDARTVLLVRAFEEADHEGAVLPLAERRAATERALATDAAPETLVTMRARALLERLDGRAPGLDMALRATQEGIPVRAVAWIVAFLLGAALNALGPERHVNLLQVPLLGLLALNGLIYAVLAVRACRRSEDRGESPGFLRGALGLWAAGTGVSALRRLLDMGRERVAVAGDAYRRFLGDWARTARPLLLAHAAHVLHVGAFLAMLGAIAAMYVRGLSTDFRVGWESTFLDPGQVETFLRVVLAPGLLLLGGGVGDVAALRDVADGAPAARWIHLWAVSAAAYVLVPRAVLAYRASARARALSSALPLDFRAAYFQRLLADVRGEAVRVRVLPYSYTPNERTRDRLTTFLHTMFGSRAVIDTAPPLEYGAEPEPPDGPCALLFSLAQTPEDEVHGALVASLAAQAGRERTLLALIDAAPYRERADDERLAERRSAWTRVVQSAGVLAVHMDLSSPPTDQNLTDAGEGLYPGDAH